MDKVDGCLLSTALWAIERVALTVASSKSYDSTALGTEVMLQLCDELSIVCHGLLRCEELHVLLERLLEGLGHAIVSVLGKHHEGSEGWGVLPDEP